MMWSPRCQRVWWDSVSISNTDRSSSTTKLTTAAIIIITRLWVTILVQGVFLLFLSIFSATMKKTVEVNLSHFSRNFQFKKSSSLVDKASRLSTRIDIWILLSDTVLLLLSNSTKSFTNSETAMLSTCWLSSFFSLHFGSENPVGWAK